VALLVARDWWMDPLIRPGGAQRARSRDQPALRQRSRVALDPL